MLKSNINTAQVSQYPKSMATTLESTQALKISGLVKQDLQENLYLPQAGLVNPKALADTILAHPNIQFIHAEVDKIIPSIIEAKTSKGICLNLKSANVQHLYADSVVIAIAHKSQTLDSRIFEYRKIRGQLSWFEPTQQQLETLPNLPLKYGGYCAVFTPRPSDDELNPVTTNCSTFLLGASFVRNDIATDIRESEHRVNKEKLVSAIPELEKLFISQKQDAENEYSGWKARAGIRAQTPDYHPLVGQVDNDGLIWTLSGMGSKGYAFAPLCAEALADMMTGQFCPLSISMLAQLSPQRKSLQKPLR